MRRSKGTIHHPRDRLFIGGDSEDMETGPRALLSKNYEYQATKKKRRLPLMACLQNRGE